MVVGFEDQLAQTVFRRGRFPLPWGLSGPGQWWWNWLPLPALPLLHPKAHQAIQQFPSNHARLPCTFCSPDVRKVIEQASDLAPLHNPPNLQGIDAALKTFPESPQVCVPLAMPASCHLLEL